MHVKGKGEPEKEAGQQNTCQMSCLLVAIFDSSIDICPVCGVGREQFVEVGGGGD